MNKYEIYSSLENEHLIMILTAICYQKTVTLEGAMELAEKIFIAVKQYSERIIQKG